MARSESSRAFRAGGSGGMCPTPSGITCSTSWQRVKNAKADRPPCSRHDTGPALSDEADGYQDRPIAFVRKGTSRKGS